MVVVEHGRVHRDLGEREEDSEMKTGVGERQVDGNAGVAKREEEGSGRESLGNMEQGHAAPAVGRGTER